MNPYQAIYVAADALYAALKAAERGLSEQVDAVAQREALRLATTRLAIQKLMGVYASAPLPAPKVAPEEVDAVPVGQLDRQPPTPGKALAAKPAQARKR
jgi:hypothetical protein